MKSYKEVTSIISKRLAKGQFSSYMDGSNQYEAIVSPAAEVIALTFGRNYEKAVATLRNQVKAEFNRLVLDHARQLRAAPR